MKSKIVVIFLSIALSNVYAQVQSISYDNFLKELESRNPLFQRATNFKTIGRKQLLMARGGYDPQFNLELKNKFFSSKNYYSYIQGEVKQQLFASQYLKAGYEYGQGVFVNPEFNTPSYGLYYVSFETQLLQGLTFDKQRADILKGKEYQSYFSLERNILVNNLLLEAGSAYAEWSYAYRQLNLYSYYMALAKQRLDAMNDLAKIGERAAADTVEAAIFYQSRLLEYNIAMLEWREKIAQTMTFFYNDYNVNANVDNSFPSDTLDLMFEKVKNKILQILKADSANNPILAQYQIKQNILEIDKRFHREMIKPQLSVNYNLLSSNQTNSIAQFSTNNYKWGASLSFPLFFRNSTNRFKIASIEALNNSMELNFKKLEIDYKTRLLKQNISLLSEQISASIKNVDYSKILLEAEKLKFNVGESSLFLLNTRENRLMEAELKLAEYKLKYIITSLKLIHINGNLNYRL